jgi:hypothetical protein
MVKEKLGDKLKKVVDDYLDAYHLGAVGHDILYWAGTDGAKDKKLGLVFGFDQNGNAIAIDPHENATGRMIVNLINDYIELGVELRKKEEVAKPKAKIDMAKEVADVGKELSDISKMLTEIDKEKTTLQQYLAFILGWITHWTTDLYIHALVDLYGGPYLEGTEHQREVSRHAQLELIETKFIYMLMMDKGLPEASLANTEAIWSLLSRPLATTYPDARVKIPFLGLKRIAENPEIYLNSCWTGFTAVEFALRCADQGCSNGTGRLDGTSDGNIKPGASTGMPWDFVSAYVPSSKLYMDILDPVSVKSESKPSEVTFTVTVADTGRYGRFLEDYQNFIDAAIKKAASLIGTCGEVLNDKSKMSSLDSLFFNKDKKDNLSDTINILISERDLFGIDPEIIKKIDPDYFQGKNIEKISTYHFDVDTLYFDVKFTILGETKPRIKPECVAIGSLTPTGLMGSHAGIAEFTVPVINPSSASYEWELRLSLDDPLAFKKNQYRDSEFKIFKGDYTGGSLIIDHLVEKVYVEGNARIKNEHPAKIFDTHGTVIINCISKIAPKERVIPEYFDNLFEDLDDKDPEFNERIEEFSRSGLLPNLDRVKIRVYSSFLSSLNTGSDLYEIDVDFDENVDDNQLINWWDSTKDSGEKILWAKGDGKREVSLDMKDITKRVLDAYFAGNKEILNRYRGGVDIRICYFYDCSGSWTDSDHTEKCGEGALYHFEDVFCVVLPSMIHIHSAPVPGDKRRVRLIAGPVFSVMKYLNPSISVIKYLLPLSIASGVCEETAGSCPSGMKFVLHPSSTFRLEPDALPSPKDCISAIMVLENQKENESYYSEIFVVGDGGEIGLMI